MPADEEGRNAMKISEQSAKGAASCQPGATPQEHPPQNCRGLKARANLGAIRSGLQPSRVLGSVSQGVALGWHRAGALPLRIGNGPSFGAAANARGADALGKFGWAL
jgi:hypothetical protein